LLNIIVQTKDLKNLKKLTAKYSAKSLRHVVYKTAEDAGKAVAGNKGRPDGLIAEQYVKRFNDPVPFTLSSVYWSAQKNTITLHTFNADGKGTSPSKYLHPVIGGGGSEIALKFDKWLWNKNFADTNHWAYPNFANEEFVKQTRQGNARPQVYRDTQIALNKTKNDKLHRKADGPKIQDGRVFAVKHDFGSSKKVYRAGIYRVKTNDKNNFIKPLFIYGLRDSIPQKGIWAAIAGKAVRDYVMDEDRIKKNIELYAKTS
tara:strand:+ start:162 stop:938 length:777 start_codon:yes stop_codon:yes gene_type:complete